METITDVDKCNYFEGISLVKELGYKHVLLMLKFDVSKFVDGYNGFRWDKDVAKVAEFAFKNNIDANLYIECIVHDDVVRKVIDECDEDGGESDIYEDSEDDKPMAHFVDFEEKMDLRLDDGLLDKDDVHVMTR